MFGYNRVRGCRNFLPGGVYRLMNLPGSKYKGEIFMPGFEIETYSIPCGEGGFGRFPTIDRRIYVESPDLSHGIRFRASLEFGPPPASWENMGVALNVGGRNFNGVTMVVFLPPDRYAHVYDILRSEKPVHLLYRLCDLPSNPGGTTKYITRAAVGSAPELPGEGPLDPDSLVLL
jgi:hypothetical protein